MDHQAKSTKAARWLPRMAGISMVVLALVSLVIGFGASGIGWVAAAGVLILASIISPFTGKLYVGPVLGIFLFHLFYVGPFEHSLRAYRQDPSQSLALFTLCTIILPLAAALAVIVLPRRRGKEARPD
ncbi:MAG: hypothetical protein V4578_09805 [Pseudomonadota bacterium]